ncbi:Rha family transcriptional regulator [Shewanella algae]|uniref:Rha family transcriptional regulator n=1 Tax=Shewanella algae TaxID=38313 RepID=UPI0031F5C0ED
MSSREIAELTGKQHQHIKRDIQSMCSQLGIDASSFGHTYLDNLNRQQTEYRLPRRECEILVCGYDVVRRAAVIDRWLELETKQRQLPNMTPGPLRFTVDQGMIGRSEDP